MTKIIFINLPVRDLAAAEQFYRALGCEKNEAFSSDQTTMMGWSDTITFQLLAQDYFGTFTPKKIADAKASTEVLIALSRDSRDDVDAAVNAGASAGGKADLRGPIDMGFLYNRCVQDPDGHMLEFVWMDMSDASGQQSDSA